MSKMLRLKVAAEYLRLVRRMGQTKTALIAIRAKYGAGKSSVNRYVAELRDTTGPKLGPNK